MCLPSCPRVCGLVLSILINVPLVGLVLSLESGTWELKLFAIPFAVSPVAAIIIYCNRRGSCLSRTALLLLLLSLVTKLVGATLACMGIAAASQSNAMLGALGAIVYGMVAAIFGVSALSDLYLFCTEIYGSQPEQKRERVVTNDFFS